MKPVALLLLLALAGGCSTDGGPRYSSRLNIARYTETTYPPTTELTIYEPGETVPPHKVIAMISREGHARDEGLILNAIAWKARQMGAHAIVRLPLRDQQTDYSATRLNNFSTAKTETQQPVWRVNAIRFLDSVPTASKPDTAPATR